MWELGNFWPDEEILCPCGDNLTVEKAIYWLMLKVEDLDARLKKMEGGDGNA